jgi:hypothetical protein
LWITPYRPYRSLSLSITLYRSLCVIGISCALDGIPTCAMMMIETSAGFPNKKFSSTRGRGPAFQSCRGFGRAASLRVLV